MAYVAPPVLPDFKRLQTFLTNSGVQKWNPDIYDILKRLIDANHQSQDVMVNTTIPDIVSSLTINVNGYFAQYQTVILRLTKAQVNSLNTAPLTIVTGIPGVIIIPVYSTTKYSQIGGVFSGNVTPQYQHTLNNVNIMGTGQVGSTSAAPFSSGQIIYLPTITESDPTKYIGSDLRVKSAIDVTNTITTYAGAIQLTYMQLGVNI